MNAARRTLADLGEFGAIDLLRRVLEEEGADDRRAHLGIGDDAAVFSIEPGREVVMTCDIQISGRHFLPAAFTAREIGARAMTVNLSDLAAMGARPERALVSLGLPARFLIEDLQDLYRGISDALVPHDAVVSGGNLGKISEESEWFIDITLLGTVPPGRALSRRGARAGDVIALTGTPGASAAGLALLQQLLADLPPTDTSAAGSSRDGTRDLGRQMMKSSGARVALPGGSVEKVRMFLSAQPWSAPVLDAYLRPRARIEAGRALLGIATSMIDVSDGWRSDLSHVCTASHVRARLDRPLPDSEAMEEAARYLGRTTEAWRFGPSDDYELLFTLPEHRWAEAEALLAAVGAAVARIGSMIEGEPGLELDSRNLVIPPGWDHFSDS